jgi:hypothetical protein
MPRKPLSKRTRFEILKRDGMRCRYCGATPLQSKLHVDHVVPLAEGGPDDPTNLITACADCNLGKSKVPLTEQRYSLEMVSDADRDHADQIREYVKLQMEAAAARDAGAEEILRHWERLVGAIPRQLESRIKILMAEHGVRRLLDAFEVVGRKADLITDDVDRLKYLYGVLRKMKAERPDQEPAAIAPPAKLRPNVEGHLRRIRSAVDAEIVAVNGMADLSRDEKIGRIYEVFARAALGSKRSVEKARAWPAESRKIGFKTEGYFARGFELDINAEGKVSVWPPGDDFNAAEWAWWEFHGALMEDEAAGRPPTKALELVTELNAWITIFVNEDGPGAVEHFRNHQTVGPLISHWLTDEEAS